MGYHSTLNGEILIDPPILWPDLEKSPFICTEDRWEYERLAWLRIVEEPVETAEGTLIRKKAVAIRASDADELRAGNLVSEVQEIVTAHGEGRTFTGFILVRGEESPDYWRAAVEDGRAVEVKPRIVWPDGTEEQY